MVNHNKVVELAKWRLGIDHWIWQSMLQKRVSGLVVLIRGIICAMYADRNNSGERERQCNE